MTVKERINKTLDEVINFPKATILVAFGTWAVISTKSRTIYPEYAQEYLLIRVLVTTLILLAAYVLGEIIEVGFPKNDPIHSILAYYHISEEQRIKATNVTVTSLYIVSFMICIAMRIAKGSEPWITIGTHNIFICPLIFLFSLPIIILLINRTGEMINDEQFTVLSIFILLPAVEFMLIGVVADAFVFLGVAIILFIRKVKENKLGISRLVVFSAISILIILDCIIIFNSMEYFDERFMAIVTNGKSDPYGYGFHQTLLLEVLKDSNLIGMAENTGDLIWLNDYMVDMPAMVISKFGWLAFSLMTVCSFGLGISFMQLGKDNKKTGNLVVFCTGAYFFSRTIIGLLSCFLLHMGYVCFPFAGTNQNYTVDLILFVICMLILKYLRIENNVECNENEEYLVETLDNEMFFQQDKKDMMLN